MSDLVQDIYNLVSKGSEVDERLVKEFGESLSQLIADRLKPKEPREFTLRMSNLGKGDRQLWYDKQFGRPDDDIAPHTELKFIFGDIIEQLLLFLAAASGHEVTDKQKEVVVDGIVGHIDAKIDGVTTDIKSASTHSFKKFKDGTLAENDPFGYMEQIAGYSEAEDTDGAFLAMDKQNGHIAHLPIPKSELKTLNIRARIDHLKQVMDSPTEPERCYEAEPEGKSGNMVLGVNCSYCPHKFRCWSDSNDGLGLRTFLYASGPKHFVEVKKEPQGPREITF